MEYSTDTHTLAVIGFANETIEQKFKSDMQDSVKNFDRYDFDAVKQSLFDLAENSLAQGESIRYELSSHETQSGHTETISFLKSDFETEWREDL